VTHLQSRSGCQLDLARELFDAGVFNARSSPRRGTHDVAVCSLTAFVTSRTRYFLFSMFHKNAIGASTTPVFPLVAVALSTADTQGRLPWARLRPF
jgi:hypothetical protein